MPSGRPYRVVLLALLLLIAPACGGGPTGPGGSAVAGTATFDGQTVQFTTARNASGGHRRPSNPAWPRGLLDILLSSCDRPPALVMAIYDANPSPGRYEVPGFQLASQTEGATASLQSPTEDAWNAGAVHRGSSGSITVTSISSTRLSGSFSFVLVQRLTGSIFGVPPPPPTKHIEGTFDVEIHDRVVCG